MVDVQFDGDDGQMACEGCGVLLPTFLDECPYCAESESLEYEDSQADVEAPCPECGALIYDDSERCAICGAWVSMRLPNGRSSNKKIVLLVVVLLVASILYLTLLNR
ncbi:MAG: RNA polymerase subunit RPABC4/transcription elongation factor Spt4 [Planctomycetota bacterium]|jgi:RNA polymerase subunit RPABC4/transcription elongation factor Spt4